MTACRCDEVDVLHDAEADDHTGHLVRERIEEGGAHVHYRCPQTGRHWVASFEADAGGHQSLALRRMPSAGELIERMAALGPELQAIDYAHPDVEFRPAGEHETHRGLDAARAYADRVAADPDRPRSRAISIIELGPEDALVLGEVRYRRDRRYVDLRPSSWLVSVEDGKVRRSLWFDSWDAGRAAAGVPKAALGKRVGSWLLSVALAPLRPLA